MTVSEHLVSPARPGDDRASAPPPSPTGKGAGQPPVRTRGSSSTTQSDLDFEHTYAYLWTARCGEYTYEVIGGSPYVDPGEDPNEYLARAIHDYKIEDLDRVKGRQAAMQLCAEHAAHVRRNG